MTAPRERLTWPVHRSHCVDCGVGTFTLGEYYVVNDAVWEQAWAGRRKWWHKISGEMLCIGCLEARLGRTLTKHDFTAAPVNDPDDYYDYKSDRLLNRLLASESTINKGDFP